MSIIAVRSSMLESSTIRFSEWQDRISATYFKETVLGKSICNLSSVTANRHLPISLLNVGWVSVPDQAVALSGLGYALTNARKGLKDLFFACPSESRKEVRRWQYYLGHVPRGKVKLKKDMENGGKRKTIQVENNLNCRKLPSKLRAWIRSKHHIHVFLLLFLISMLPQHEFAQTINRYSGKFHDSPNSRTLF